MSIDEIASLRRQLESKRNLIEVLAHDIRSPFAIIESCCELIKTLPDQQVSSQSERQSLLDQIATTTRGALRLLNNLLETEKINWDLTPKVTNVFIEDVFEDMEPALQVLCEKYELRFSMDCDADICGRLDEYRTKQIIDNLVQNAIKVSSPGGEILVKAETQTNQSFFNLSVQDTGPGIPKQMQTKILEKFTQMDCEGEKYGVGLGLSIVQQFVLAQGGELKIHSEEGKGSNFIVTLPRANLNSAENKPQLLLVDDDPDSMEFFRESLMEEGFLVETAKDGQIALDRIQAAPFHIVISDIRMPELDGISLVAKMAELNLNIPVILVSGQSDYRGRSILQGLTGVEYFLEKPFEMEELVNQIRSLLPRRLRFPERRELRD